jgi:hypothetical protein
MEISDQQGPSSSKLRAVHLLFWASAGIMAIAMFSYYLQLLNQSVLRGLQLREEVQHASAVKRPAKVVAASLLD